MSEPIQLKMIDAKLVRDIIMGILLLGAELSILYIIAIDVLKSVAILSLIYSLSIFIGYSLTVTLIGLCYNLSRRYGHPLPGVFTLLMRPLTLDQKLTLSRDFSGRKDFIMHEYILFRMDILVPAGMVYAAIMFVMLPTLAQTIITELVVSVLFGMYLMSYLIYTVLQAYIYSIKATANLKGEVMDISKLDQQIQVATQ